MGWGGVVKILLTSSVTLRLSLSLSSRQHNPCMTLNSWLTAPPSRFFHPTTEQHGPSAPAPFLTVSPAECSVKTEVLYHAIYEKKQKNRILCFVFTVFSCITVWYRTYVDHEIQENMQTPDRRAQNLE